MHVYKTLAGFENAIAVVAMRHGLSTQLPTSKRWLEAGLRAHLRARRTVDLTTVRAYIALARGQ
jgi:hypothetical protein